MSDESVLDCSAGADDDISLQASLSPASSALLEDQEPLGGAGHDSSDRDFTFPSDDDKQEAQAAAVRAPSASQPGSSNAAEFHPSTPGVDSNISGSRKGLQVRTDLGKCRSNSA